MSLTPAPGNDGKKGREHAADSPVAIPNSTIYAYNLDDSKTPGGLKVRFKVRVVTGPGAARYDARQAEAIREILTWAQRHPGKLRAPAPGQ
jgi:hypothetical protein